MSHGHSQSCYVMSTLKIFAGPPFALSDLVSVLDTMNILKFIKVQNTHFSASVAETIFLFFY